jgi:putrescine transport system substrate-binding protein
MSSCTPKSTGIAALAFLGLSAYLALVLTGCSARTPEGVPAENVKSSATDPETVLNVYNWADYIAPGVVPAFEREYGIKVNYDIYDSNEMLETRLLTGHTGYDVVVPSALFFERQVRAGVYERLDKAQLPNLKNVDPEAVRFMAIYDPGNQFGVVYTWLNATGISYDAVKIKARLANAPTDSWRLFFDPAVLSKFQDCGVAVIESPSDVIGAALIYLGRNPNSEAPQDLKAAEQVLLPIRKYIRYVNTDRYINDLANGEICLALGWSGDVTQARDRAREAGKSLNLTFSIPKEGSLNGADILAIPAGAPHPRNAHLFIDYLLRPDIAARNTNLFGYANGVPSSVPLLNDAVRNDPVIYPPPEVRARLVPERAKSQEYTRLLMRTWTRFKTDM